MDDSSIPISISIGVVGEDAQVEGGPDVNQESAYKSDYDVSQSGSDSDQKIVADKYGKTIEELDSMSDDDKMKLFNPDNYTDDTKFSDLAGQLNMDEDKILEALNNGDVTSLENLMDLKAGKLDNDQVEFINQWISTNEEKDGYSSKDLDRAKKYVDGQLRPDDTINRKAYESLGGIYEPEGGWPSDENNIIDIIGIKILNIIINFIYLII